MPIATAVGRLPFDEQTFVDDHGASEPRPAAREPVSAATG